MQAQLNSDNTVTLVVNRAELGAIDYALSYFVATAAPTQYVKADIDLADAIEQQTWNQHCKLVDQIQAQGLPVWA
jgi:hypothetical protein